MLRLSADQGADTPPIALTIAGSDSGGGAGIQADLKSFSALGCYGASVITAVTAQNTRAVTAIHPIPADVIAAQIDAVFDDLAVAATKVGMLGEAAVIETVARGLDAREGAVVVDPVMVAKSGDALLPDDAVTVLREAMLARADLLTPNLPEAARLLGTTQAMSDQEMEAQGRRLLALGPRAVLMKGGHGEGPLCVDILVRQAGDTLRLESPRRATRNTHGTGCTLSSAIAAGLAAGLPLEMAVRRAHRYLQDALAAADRLEVGSGHGPLHHFYALWN